MAGAYSDQVECRAGFVCTSGGTSCTSFERQLRVEPAIGMISRNSGHRHRHGGRVVGVYIDSNNAYHGFMLEVSTGTITDFDDANTPTATPSRGTFPSGINDNGQFVGDSSTGGYDTLLALPRLSALHRQWNPSPEIDEPMLEPKTQPPIERRHNPSGNQCLCVVTGYSVDSSGKRHGFIYSAGSYASIDTPRATTNPGKGGGFTGTLPLGMDSAGDVVGSYTDSSGSSTASSFLQEARCPHDSMRRAKYHQQSVNFGEHSPPALIQPAPTFWNLHRFLGPWKRFVIYA